MEQKHFSVQQESAIGYGVSMLLAVAFFEAANKFIAAMPIALVPYISVVILAAWLGWRLGAWYLPVSGISPKLEAIGAPIVIILIAVFSAGIFFGIAGCFWESLFQSRNTQFNMKDALQFILGGGIYAGLLFIIFSWPVLISGYFFTSLILYFRHSSVFSVPP